MARVLFAHAHLLRFDAKQLAIGKPYAPLATLIAAGELRARGHEVALFDPMLDDDVSGFGVALRRHRPDVVVLYDDAFNWFTKMCLSSMRDAALTMIREAAPSLPVVVFGHDAADHPQPYLEAGASFVIVGEGERTLDELLANAPTDFDIKRWSAAVVDVPGLVVKHRGLVRRTGSRALLRQLDTLALPAWDIADVERYRRFWRARHGYFSMNVVTTRGCPYRCNWCAKPVYGDSYSSRSVASVVDELRLLRRDYAPDHLWFADDILGLKPGWLEAWSKALVAEGLVTPFLCQTRADLMTPTNVEALARAGARDVWLGAESGSQKILDAMQKGIRVDDVRRARRALGDQGVRVGLFLQFGYAGETWDDIEATRTLVRELLPDDIGISVSYPLPGTRYYERVRAQLGEKTQWTGSDDLDPLVPATFTPEFYRTLSRLVHADLRARRGLVAAREVLASPRVAGRQRWRDTLAIRELTTYAVERTRLESLRRHLTSGVIRD